VSLSQRGRRLGEGGFRGGESALGQVSAACFDEDDRSTLRVAGAQGEVRGQVAPLAVEFGVRGGHRGEASPRPLHALGRQ
jgi:hypothetical protein